MKFLARSAAAGAIACGLVLGSAALPSALHTTSVSYAATTKKAEDSAAVKAVRRAIQNELKRERQHKENLNPGKTSWKDDFYDDDDTCKNFSNVKELSLSGIRLKDDAKAQDLLKNLKGLTSLSITNCGLTNDELKSIIGSNKLTYLDVSGNKLENLNDLPNTLKSLVANNNAITDISGISSLTNLGLLQLRGNKLEEKTDANASVLTYLKGNLYDLELSGKFANNYKVKETLITVTMNNKKKQLEIDELKKQLADEISSIDSSHSLLESYLRLQNAHPSVRYAILYRLYNETTGEHLFTPKEAEKNNLVALGWKLEGAAGLIPATEGDEVYRLYNPWTGEHHYTTDTNEVKNLVKIGWKDEGVCFYSSRSTKRTPVYSLYNPNRTEFYHHYTAKLDEIEKNVRDGWKKEGVKWYVEEV